MAYTQLNPRHSPGARVEKLSDGSSHYLLSIPAGFSDSYRLAQLDDYTKLTRRQFAHRIPISLGLSARTSSAFIAGTWGFGLWNDPFGLSLGFGGNPFRLPALPNAAWFFGASEENYLSFASGLDTGKTSTRPTRPPVANGFIAQTFRAPKFHSSLILAGLALPFSRKTTRRLLGRVIEEDGVQLLSAQVGSSTVQLPVSGLQNLSVDPTQWHRYRLNWREKRVSFEVDDVLVFETPVSPNPPLGLVIWIDNQYAAFTPEGKVGFGVLANPEPAWLEVKDIELIAP